MNLISRLFRSRPDPREELRPLWHSIVEISRERRWYESCGVADTVAGRFDMITAVLGMTLLRMEKEPELVAPSVLLTELFVEDMDGQLRESGVGDMVVGKHVGKLMSVLGGRLGAYRSALADEEPGAFALVLRRNVTMVQEEKSPDLASGLRALRMELEELDGSAILDGEIPR